MINLYAIEAGFDVIAPSSIPSILSMPAGISS
jgi:hypothetical protein